MMFICNSPHCQHLVTDLALISFCSHIFCSKCFSRLKRLKCCLFCYTDLKIEQADVKGPEPPLKVKVINLKGLKEHLSKDMIGLSFTQILEVIKKPLEFCNLQSQILNSQNHRLVGQMNENIKTFMNTREREAMEKKQLEIKLLEMKNIMMKDQITIKELTKKLYDIEKMGKDGNKK